MRISACVWFCNWFVSIFNVGPWDSINAIYRYIIIYISNEYNYLEWCLCALSRTGGWLHFISNSDFHWIVSINWISTNVSLILGHGGLATRIWTFINFLVDIKEKYTRFFLLVFNPRSDRNITHYENYRKMRDKGKRLKNKLIVMQKNSIFYVFICLHDVPVIVNLQDHFDVPSTVALSACSKESIWVSGSTPKVILEYFKEQDEIFQF